MAVLAGTGAEVIYVLTVPGAEAQRLWPRLRELVSHVGLWPIIIGQESDFERHDEDIAEQHDPRIVLRLGEEIDASEWIKEHLGSTEEDGPEWEMPHGECLKK